MRVVMLDPAAFAPFHDDALCRALAARGARVELATAPFVYHPWPAALGYARYEAFPGGSGGLPPGGSRLLRLARRWRRAAVYPVRWLAFARAIGHRLPDVVHQQWSVLPGLERRTLRRLRRRGVAIVQTAHNAASRAGERTWRPGYRALLAEADAVVALSEATGDLLRAAMPELAGRLRVIAPGIEPGPATDRDVARERLGLAAEAPIALFAGLLKPYKGVDLLLDAFAGVVARLPEARLVIAGLPQMPWTPIERRIGRLALDARVRCDLRYLPQEVMDDYFAAADLVVLPYRDGSQSAVLGAALGAGRPVVASAVGGLPEMLAVGGGAMLVTPGDTAALSRAMLELLGDRARAAALGERCGEAARARFSWPVAAAATMALYRELVAGESRR